MKLSHQIGVYTAVALIAAVLVPVGLASNPGAKKSGSSLSLVVLDSSGNAAASTVPQWGDQVTFDVSTTAASPAIELDCSQSGVLVYRAVQGVGPSYPYHPFILSSTAWTGGAADCTSTLYNVNKNGSTTTLATLGFSVAA
jgi:hypothetical protein